MTAFKNAALIGSSIANEVIQGLSARPKRLPPKLFYDAAGSRLFEQITATDEYYPTRTERAILEKYSGDIVQEAGKNLTVIELGAGSASKTALLIEALSHRQIRVDFYPVDVSPSSLSLALNTLEDQFSSLRVKPIIADYSQALPNISSLPGHKLVLFIGSSIGNFEPAEAVAFLTRVRHALQPGDALLLGADLIKDPGVLHAAYNDNAGLTAEFNKNVLARINRELGGSFDLDTFAHVAFWNAAMSRIEMHLESEREQRVWIADLDQTFRFARAERIHTENSYKFSLTSVTRLLQDSGFHVAKTWCDPQRWFCEVLARA